MVERPDIEVAKAVRYLQLRDREALSMVVGGPN
jgi:hypothetical protein